MKKISLIASLFILIGCTNDPNEETEIADQESFYGSSEHWEVNAEAIMLQGRTAGSDTELHIEIEYIGDVQEFDTPVHLQINRDWDEQATYNEEIDMNPDNIYEIDIYEPNIIQNYRHDVGLETHYTLQWEENNNEMEEEITLELSN